MRVAEILRAAARSLFCREVECEPINLKSRLAKAFLENGYGELAAYEQASAWLERFVEIIKEEIAIWESSGVPAPICVEEVRAVAFGFGHDSYRTSLTGALDAEFWNLAASLEGLTPREMLFCTTLLLFAMGCSKILVVDGPNDGGADVVGVVEHGRFAGLIVFAQSKSSASALNKNTIRGEVAKYRESAAKMRSYASALEVNAVRSGTTGCYLIATNALVEDAATAYAAEVGVLVRSRHQVAYALREAGITAADLENAGKSVSATLTRDLSRNLHPLIAEVLG